MDHSNQKQSGIQIMVNGVVVPLDKKCTCCNCTDDKKCWVTKTIPRPDYDDNVNNVNKYQHKRVSTLKNTKLGILENPLQRASSTELVNMVDKTLIGNQSIFQGPFGCRKVVYVDHTASGKPLDCIENFIYKNILPFYANTHTVSSYTGIQTSEYREEARRILGEATGADPEHDVVLFCGAGSTACIHKLAHHVLHLGDENSIYSKRPIYVFIGPFEHHSNILPWREAGVNIVNVPISKYGTIDLKYLKSKLRTVRQNHPTARIIGCFSVASNVTGIVSDDVALSILMHSYGGVAFFDYAAGAPHVKINMNPKLGDPNLEKLTHKDALYFSGHKFIGGTQTTGVLVAKKFLFENPTPHSPGGGTVTLVTEKRHVYLNDVIEREEGGTPNIVENIRLGLVMKLKMSIQDKTVIALEAYFTKRAFQTWSTIPNLIILGGYTNPRIPIISFLIEHIDSGFYLHSNFVASVLNDLFGIQARGGCMCAGPYGQTLLKVGEKLANVYEQIFANPHGGNLDLAFKPGFTRISFPYHAKVEEIDFLIDAVSFVAEHGWKLLPLYTCNLKSGSFTAKCHSHKITKAKSLNSLVFGPNGIELDPREDFSCSSNIPLSYDECLEFAHKAVHSAFEQSIHESNIKPSVLDSARTRCRWFLLASDTIAYMKNPALARRQIKSCRLFTASSAQFKNKKIEKVVSQVYSGSCLAQVLNSVWTDPDHQLTHELLREDLKLQYLNPTYELQNLHVGGHADDNESIGYATYKSTSN